jgi:hypothetical protein
VKVRRIVSNIAASDPRHWQRDLAVSYAHLAVVSQKMGASADALSELRQGQAIMGRIVQLLAKFTDARLAEGNFETYLHERENAKKPRVVRLSRPQLPMINCSAARRA